MTKLKQKQHYENLNSSKEEQSIIEVVELVGLQTIIGTGNNKHLKAGVEIPVSAELAMLLIKKGAATLKE